MGRRFDPAHLARLLDPDRRRYEEPERVLDLLHLREGEVLADVGAGPGWFALPAALRVGSAGRVYALDVQETMLEVLGRRAAEAGAGGVIVPVRVAEGQPWPLPDGGCDAALVANVYHEVADRPGFLRELYRILRPGGRVLVVVEWRPEPTPVGPPPEERLAPEAVAGDFARAGFRRPRRSDPGPYHYAIGWERP